MGVKPPCQGQTAPFLTPQNHRYEEKNGQYFKKKESPQSGKVKCYQSTILHLEL